jgi:glycosyltransferase involved in cell wall biosynthesis
MKVLQIVKTSEAAYWAARQAMVLARRGVSVHVVLPSASGAAIPVWEHTGAALHFLDCSLPLSNPLKLPNAAKKVRQLVDQIDPDLIHSHSVTTTMMLRIALGRNHRVPRVFQVPGPLHLEHWYTRQAELALAGENDFWIASSEFTRELYRAASVAADRLFLSYYSTDTSVPGSQRAGYLRKRLNIPQKALVVGNINLIYPPKRFLGHRIGLKCHEDVIEAITLVQRKQKDVWGVLVGGTFGKSPAYENKLKQFADQKGAGRILMPGKFSPREVTLSWPDFDCAVHVPLSENCGGVIEPLMAKVPTIAGRVGGLPEVVHDGVTGKLVPIRRPDLLAEAILDVLERQPQYKSMAERGCQLVKAMFDSQRCGDEVLAIYRHILSHDARPDEFSSEQFLQTQQSALAASL